MQQVLGRGYAITDQLTGGGMSTVFLADDLTLNRRVVIKVLPRELASTDAIDRFKRDMSRNGKGPAEAGPCASCNPSG